MEQEKQQDSAGTIYIDPRPRPIENTILALLKNHNLMENQIIDVPRLQKECQDRGITTHEFSYGFIRLLTRRLLEPRGDFNFSLALDLCRD